MSEDGLKIAGKFYPLPIDDVLADLTGSETLMLEEYIGGWDKLDMSGHSTRSVIALVWLAKHHAGEDMELAEIEEMKGLVFGNTVEVVDGPPDGAADAASSSPETSDSSGPPSSPEQTLATA